MSKAFLLAALALGTAVVPAAAQAGSYGDAPADPSPAAFWAQLGDTTLARLVGDAMAANADLRGAEARVRAARSERRLSTFDYAPTITATGGYTRQRVSANQLPGAPTSLRDQEWWDGGFDATWELDVFGRVRRTVAARSAAEASVREDARWVRVSLAAEVARAYYELRGAERQLQVARRNAENQRSTLQLTVDRLAAGRGTALERERASAQLSSTLAAVPMLEARASAARARLAVLLDRVPGSDVVGSLGDGGLPALPAAPPAAVADSALRQRPDVRSAERRLAAQTALVGAARASYLPRLGVYGGIGLNAPSADLLGRSEARRYAVGPVISWPAFDLGRVRARVDAARAEADAARASYDLAVLSAREEAENARVLFDRTRERLGYLREAADASQRGAELARLRFDAGAAGFLEVLDAERTLLDAQERLAQGETDAAQALVALYRASGGGWVAADR
jgi:NodT family efflux transporter outer membrane factor (OMF) lipoprotein